MKLSASNRKFIREVERLCGVKVRMEHTKTGHRRLYLPDGRYVTSSLTGDNNASRATANEIRRLFSNRQETCHASRA